MGPHIRLTAAILVPLLGFGCVGQRREVRLHADGAPPVVHVPESGGQPIEIPEAELWGAFREAGRHVMAPADPLAAAQETFGLAERSGTYLYYARTGRLVAESLDDGLVEVDGSAEAVTRGYLEWCGGTKLGPGDCLRLLSHSKVLTPHRRYVVALVMAMALSFGPMFDSLEGLADPNMVAVTLASAASMYLLLLVVPEPLSKAIAIGLTVTLIGYIGLDLFWSLVHGWKALVSAVDRARNFSDMWLAARDFGQVLGPQMGQLLLLLVSRSLGKGIAAPGKPLPRFSEASAQAKKLLRVRLAAATAVRTVTLGSGVITISLASSATVVTSPSSTASSFGPAPATKGGQKRALPGLKIESKQFGKKVGKHAEDFGLDPSNASDRQWVRDRVESIVGRYDDVRQGPWNPRGGGGNDYLFYRQGTDVVVTKPSGEFVTVLPGGQTNGWFNGATSLLP